MFADLLRHVFKTHWFGCTFWFLNCEVIFTNGSKHKYLHLFHVFTIDILFCPREIWLHWWIWIQVHEISSFCSKVEVFAQKSTNLWWKTFDSWQQSKEILKSIKLWSFFSNFQGFSRNFKDFRDIEEICGEKCSNRGSRARGFRASASRDLKRFLTILAMSCFWMLTC